ncbi:unnamed protein product, partial [Arctogadus glacialis]
VLILYIAVKQAVRALCFIRLQQTAVDGRTWQTLLSCGGQGLPSQGSFSSGLHTHTLSNQASYTHTHTHTHTTRPPLSSPTTPQSSPTPLLHSISHPKHPPAPPLPQDIVSPPLPTLCPGIFVC